MFAFLANPGARVYMLAHSDDYMRTALSDSGDLNLSCHGGGGEDVVVLCTKASEIGVVVDQNISRSR